MYNPRICAGQLALLTLSVLICTGSRSAFAHPPPQTVCLGSDYFQTAPGTFANLPGIGPVGLVGNPIGPGNTDTIVQRQQDADITSGSATIPIQIVALSLKSAAPVNLGGSFFDVFVTLDPNPGGHDTGQMTIKGSTNGGTFNSFFDVFFDIALDPIGGGAPIMMNGIDLGNLYQNDAPWNPIPPINAVLVPGAFGDQNANEHTSGVPTGEVDFFPGSIPHSSGGPGGPGTATPGDAVLVDHFKRPPGLADHISAVAGQNPQLPFGGVNIIPNVPEPSAMLLYATGLTGLAGFLGRRRRPRV